MAKYRKKPVIVEAEPYELGMEDGFKCELKQCKIAPDSPFCFARSTNCEHFKPYIQTLEGSLFISPGDYIITGVKGERYPCKPDVFEATYEPVEEAINNA